MSSGTPIRYLFGGDRPWNVGDWTDSDDRVRGGRSQSYLTVDSSACAHFHGTLDITALGGAGFASQRTTDILDLDLSKHDGIVLAVSEVADDKTYTLTLKDDIPPKRDDGRDQSTVNWEYSFTATPGRDIVIRWSDLKPTYRGKPRPGAKPLDLASIKRVSFMMRSFFGEQSGAFSLRIRYVAAFVGRPGTSATEYSTGKGLDGASPQRETSSWKAFFCGLLR